MPSCSGRSDAAEAANLAKSRYIIGISHEIRTPLNAISGYAQLLERDGAEFAADAVRVIRRSATHLADLVDGLIDVSRIENGSVRIARERVNLIELITQIVDMFRIQAAARGIQFEHNRPGNLPTWIYTDQKRLRQILINLISNAIKYTPLGLGRAQRQVARSGRRVRGGGQRRRHRGSRSGAYLRAVRPASGRCVTSPGVGLGLTITRMLVDIMGGQLTVEASRAPAARFRVKMFFSEAPARPQSTGLALDRRHYPGARRRILVIDDDAVHLDFTRDLLAPIGFDLDFAATGEAGIEAFGRRRPDLVIMDVAMPAMDGWEAARAIREHHGDEVPILMVSANVHDFQRIRRPDDPHDDYLLKPYDIDMLLDRIGVLLDLDDAVRGRTTMSAAAPPAVLIVDDDADARAFLEGFARAEGFAPLLAGDGAEALRMLELRLPDIILLDAVMPGMDGFETCRRIKAIDGAAHVPVIFMTGLTETEHVVQGLSAGGVDYVTKPLVLDELAARIRVHLGNAQATRSALTLLDTVGARMLTADHAGAIGWATPEARRLIEGLDSETSEAFAVLLARRAGGGGSEELFEAGALRLTVTLLGPGRPGEFLFKLSPSIEGMEAGLLRDAFGVTPREADVLLWTARGKSNRDMSEILNISPRTVNKHLEQIFIKIGVENRASAAAAATRVLLRER